MKRPSISISLKAAVLITAASYSLGAQAITTPATPLSAPHPYNVSTGSIPIETVAFSDSAEAGMLHRAYHILATGDHDYHGHRARAMHQVEAAAKLLGLDLSGDLRDREKQVLSDDLLREASNLISSVLNSAEVKDQKRVTKHLLDAVKQINTALSVH